MTSLLQRETGRRSLENFLGLVIFIGFELVLLIEAPQSVGMANANAKARLRAGTNVWTEGDSDG
jgi:hypothetical protein